MFLDSGKQPFVGRHQRPFSGSPWHRTDPTRYDERALCEDEATTVRPFANPIWALFGSS